MRTGTLIAYATILLATPFVSAATITINADGTGDFPTIQAAIDAAAPNDVIELTNGTYTGDGNRDLNFSGKAITVRGASGDPALCVVDCGGEPNDPHRGFIFVHGETADTRVEDLTISNGYVLDSGGAIFCDASSPTLVRCHITDSTAVQGGGGIYCDNMSNPVIDHCLIASNHAHYPFGGGVACMNQSNAVITGSTITKNTVATGGHGGGIVCYLSDPTITQTTITDNATTYGGGVHCHGSSPLFEAVLIADNSAGTGGGGLHCRSASSPTLNNCTIAGNHVAEGYGGGVYVNDSTAHLVNCRILRNCASYGGGAARFQQASPLMLNCLFANNASQFGGVVQCLSGAYPILTNCILWDNLPEDIELYGGLPQISFSHMNPLFPGVGNSDADPLLTGDGHLTAASPCINAGDPNGVYTDMTDMDDEPRVANDRVDIGPDEWLDTDGDALPDWWEHLHFDHPTAAQPGADNDGDDRPNVAEYEDGTNPWQVPLVYYVSTAGSDLFDGRSPFWNGLSGPKATIQAAIDRCHPSEGDRVILADGTYTGDGNRDIDFAGREIMVRSASGDPATCVVDCAGEPNDPHRGFHFRSGEGPNAVIAGLTISGGDVTAPTGLLRRGAGIACEFSSPTIMNCVLRDGRAEFGGGMANDSYSAPTIIDCHFEENYATGNGGGIDNHFSQPTISGCTFVKNEVDWQGAAISSGDSTVMVTDCVFLKNRAFGGANWDGRGGGAAWHAAAPATYTNCAFYGNRSEFFGGAISTVLGSPIVLVQCRFAGNFARVYGGAIFSNSTSPVIMRSCTASQNESRRAGALFWSVESAPQVTHSILHGNRPDEIYAPDGNDPASANAFTYSNVAGLAGQPWVGPGCIDVEPDFVADPDDGGDGWTDDPRTPDLDEGANDDFGDLHLRTDSLCIDAGDPNAAVDPNAVDIDGDARVRDCRIDIGADETTDWRDCDSNGISDGCDIADCSGASACGDCNVNRVPDVCDIASGAALDRNENGIPDECEICPGDANCDAFINFRDIDYFVAAMNDSYESWAALFSPGPPPCVFENNDCNGDGFVNFGDIEALVDLMNTECE